MLTEQRKICIRYCQTVLPLPYLKVPGHPLAGNLTGVKERRNAKRHVCGYGTLNFLERKVELSVLQPHT